MEGYFAGKQAIELLEAAIRQTKILQYQAGGMVVFVEADDKEKLLIFRGKILFWDFIKKSCIFLSNPV